MLSTFEKAIASLDGHRLILHRQPVKSIASSPDTPSDRFEILSRLWDGDRLFTAGEFIPWIRDRPDMQTALDFWVFEQVGALMKCDSLNYNINVSEASFSEWLPKKLGQVFDFEPSRVTLELSEAINWQQGKIKVVRQLSDIFPVELDDVGMAPLLQMITLPISGIKIDGSIIQELPHNPRANALIRSLFLFCQSSDLTVTCEYVTTLELWKQLRAIAHDFPYLTVFVQGAAVGKTEPAQ